MSDRHAKKTQGGSFGEGLVKRDYRSFDFLLALAAVALAVFGVIIIGSATRATLGGDAPAFHTMQKFWVASGVIILLAAAFVDYHFISRFYIIIYAFSIALLVLVLFMSANDTTGTARWIRFAGFNFQPSEFSKLAMILFLSYYIEKFDEQLNRPLVLLLTLALIFLPVALIAVQPSMSEAIVVSALSFGIMFAGKLSYKYIIPVVALVVPLVSLVYYDLTRPTPFIGRFLQDYQLSRVMLWIEPDAADPKYFQTMQSIRAIGSGLFDGKGLGNRDTVVPFVHNDFIFAVIGEELGFVGAMAVIGCILLIVLKCLLIAYRAADVNGRLIATGAAVMLAFQSFVHIGVATGALPNTGTPLPFISYGGSSMWVCMAAVGLCINVGMTKSKGFFDE